MVEIPVIEIEMVILGMVYYWVSHIDSKYTECLIQLQGTNVLFIQLLSTEMSCLHTLGHSKYW